MKLLHRIRRSAILSGIVASGLFAWQGVHPTHAVASASSSTCGYPNGPKTGTMIIDNNEYKACSALQTLTPPGYLGATLSNLPANSQLSNGLYPGYCVDLTGTILDNPLFGNIVYTVDFWSSLDKNLPTAVKQVTDKASATTYTIPWDKVNYLLNTYPTESWLNIQAAFWDLTHGCTQAPGSLYTCGTLRPAPSYFPYGTTNANGPFGCPGSSPAVVDESRVQFLVNDANANGAGFTPKAGDKIASVGQITNCTPSSTCNQYLPYQVIFVPTTCPTCTGAVGDYVWKDLNDNGIQDSGEPGIPGVEVKLSGTDAYGQTIDLTTATDKDGKYQFNNLCASTGKYTVTVSSATLPTDVIETINRSGDGDDNKPTDSNEPAGTTVSVTTDSSINMTVDFGYTPLCTGSIGDFAWQDLNTNGTQDSGEPGIQGATVSISGINDYGVSVDMTATTDANGAYTFKGLCKGSYTIKVDTGIPAGFIPTSPLSTNGGDLNSTDSNDPAGTTAALDSDTASNTTVDFGYKPNCQGTAGDFVWKDLNANGKQDSGEAGVKGVTLTLLGTNGYAQLVNMTATTDDNGAYTFNGLCKGSYSVTIAPSTVPAGWGPTSPLIDNGTVQVGDDSNNPGGTTVTLSEDSDNNPTLDFGYVPICTGSIGDFIWNDKNVDGTQNDGTDSGIEGVRVQVTGNNLYGQSVSLIATSANGGSYQFTKLCQGTYTVAIDASSLPPGFVSTSPRSANGGDGSANDSNEPAGTSVSLSSDSTSNQTIDFGYYKPAPAIMVTETCANAPAPNQPMTFTATISNTGNETLTGITCTDTLGTTKSVADIFPGASASLTFSYVQSTSPLSDAVTCGAKGAISATSVTATSAAKTCAITTAPALTVTETCTNAEDPSKPIVFTAAVANTGNETLTGITCKDTLGATKSVNDILPGATGSVTFSYVQSTSPLSDAVTCTAKGAISATSVSATSAVKSCTITPSCIPCINGVTNMTLKLNYRTSYADPRERVRVRADGISGKVLYDSWYDANTSNPGLSVGATFSFVVPPAVKQIVVTLQGRDHPSEFIKAKISAECDLTIGTVTGTYPSYITFKVMDATLDGPKTCGVTPTCTGAIGNFAWDDTNSNGIQDSGEAGLAGAVITLKGTNAYGTTVNQSITTPASGAYQFTGLCQGSYTVSTTAPNGYTATLTGKGTPSTDSNASPTGVVLLTDSSSDQTIDFGFNKSCTPCTNGVTNMTLRINGRTASADPTERVRVRADSLTGTVLFDSWNDANTSNPGLAVGTDFSFAVPAAAKKVVVTLQGRDHPSEFVKANISAECDLVTGTITGTYPSYITFKVVDATLDGSKTCNSTNACVIRQFNLISLGNAVSYSHVDGRSFIGGTLSGGDYVQNSSATPASTYAGLTVLGATSGVHVNGLGGVFGGNLSSSIINSGIGVVFGSATYDTFNGPAYVGSSSSGNNFNGGINSSLATGSAAAARNSTDFNAVLNTLSTQLSLLSSTGSTVSFVYGKAVFNAVPNSNGVAVFNLAGIDTTVFSKGEFEFNLNGATTIILNSDETTVTISANFLNGCAQSIGAKTLWNFYKATNVTINNQFGGSVLAPLAAFTNYNNIEGSVFVKTISQRGEIHLQTFSGTVPSLFGICQ